MQNKLAFVFVAIMTCSVAAFPQAQIKPAHTRPSAKGLDLSGYRLTKVYSNDLSKIQKIVFEKDLIEKGADGKWSRKHRPEPKAEWIVEGLGGVDIRDGKLRASPLPFDTNGTQVTSGARSHLVVWNRNIFPADLMLEFDMNPNGSANGLTIVFFCATGKIGGDIFDLSLPPRRADYKNYHSGAIANYSDAYWSRNTTEEGVTNRLRKNPGFELVAEGDSLTTGATDVTHHIRILKSGAHIEVEINGKVVISWNDPGRPLGAGRIGFRSMEGVSLITYDNIKVWKVSKK
jgi:hypothetical protein